MHLTVKDALAILSTATCSKVFLTDGTMQTVENVEEATEFLKQFPDYQMIVLQQLPNTTGVSMTIVNPYKESHAALIALSKEVSIHF